VTFCRHPPPGPLPWNVMYILNGPLEPHSSYRIYEQFIEGFNVTYVFHSFKTEQRRKENSLYMHIQNYNDSLSDIQLRSNKKCKKYFNEKGHF